MTITTGTDLAMRLWCALRRCWCQAQGSAGTCMSCTDDLANLAALGFVNAGGEWVS